MMDTREEILIRRRGMMVAQQGGLPYDAQIEYIECSGTQYIDTGIVVNDVDTINIRCLFYTKSGDNFVLRDKSGATNGVYLDLNSNSKWYVKFGSSSSVNTSGGVALNSVLDLQLRKNYFSVNGIQRLTPGFSSMPTSPIRLFRNSTLARIYSFNIVDDNNNKRIDLIPVRVGTVGYMYDRVSRQLFGNAGTGDFILGPDVQ